MLKAEVVLVGLSTFDSKSLREGVSARARLKPSFLVVGAQKAGTTSLHRVLATADGLAMPERKEMRFFSERYGLGTDYYRRHFPLKTSALVRWGTAATGEATPDYMFYRSAVDRIHAFNPRMRLVITLRHPIDRAVSHYWHSVRYGNEDRDMDAAFRAELELFRDGGVSLKSFPKTYSFDDQKHSYLRRGLYGYQLQYIADTFGHGQMFVTSLDSMSERWDQESRRLSEFLGVRIRDKHFNQSNPGTGERAPELKDGLLHELRSLFREDLPRVAPFYPEASTRWSDLSANGIPVDPDP